MTRCKSFVRQKRKKAALGAGEICFGLFSVFCLLLILRNSELAIGYMTRGLLLCAKTVIPSLFPFMVLSELIVSGGLGEKLPRGITAPMQKIFDLPAAGCCAVLLGMVCGFPVGAKCAILAYDRGALTKEETEQVLLFSNNPSSAFLISAVGVSLWGNRAFGLSLYFTAIGVSLLTGFLYRVLRTKKEEPPHAVDFPLSSSAPLKGANLFTSAVRSATGSILLVCAYVVFFSTLVGTLNLVLGSFHLPQALQAAVFCLFELSGGVNQAATLSNTAVGALLCAFATGWSGLSVHCQILSICDGKGLSFRAYFLAKLFQGILCALLFGILIGVFPTLLSNAKNCLF